MRRPVTASVRKHERTECFLRRSVLNCADINLDRVVESEEKCALRCLRRAELTAAERAAAKHRSEQIL